MLHPLFHHQYQYTRLLTLPMGLRIEEEKDGKLRCHRARLFQRHLSHCQHTKQVDLHLNQ